MTDREYVLQLLVRQARHYAEIYSIARVDDLTRYLVTDYASHAIGGSGPGRGDQPEYRYACGRQGVWVGTNCYLLDERGEVAIRWREVAEVALGAPRQAVLL